MDGVELTFSDDALRSIARQSLEQKCGARGLRAILERSMLQIMYEVPNNDAVREVVIDEGVITGEGEPTYRTQEEFESAS